LYLQTLLNHSKAHQSFVSIPYIVIGFSLLYKWLLPF